MARRGGFHWCPDGAITCDRRRRHPWWWDEGVSNMMGTSALGRKRIQLVTRGREFLLLAEGGSHRCTTEVLHVEVEGLPVQVRMEGCH